MTAATCLWGSLAGAEEPTREEADEPFTSVLKRESFVFASTPDGFFRSGDIGEMDERGYIRIVDRKKDMILVSGFNVYPNEVEDVVALLPGVLECAAVGVPDDKTGEAVKVVIVRKDAAVDEAKVKAWCETNLTGYKRPRFIEFRTELPKTPVGKILRRELRDRKPA